MPRVRVTRTKLVDGAPFSINETEYEWEDDEFEGPCKRNGRAMWNEDPEFDWTPPGMPNCS